MYGIFRSEINASIQSIDTQVKKMIFSPKTYLRNSTKDETPSNTDDYSRDDSRGTMPLKSKYSVRDGSIFTGPTGPSLGGRRHFFREQGSKSFFGKKKGRRLFSQNPA